MYAIYLITRFLLLAGLVVLFSACSSLPEIPVTDESYQIWAKRQQSLEEIDTWEINARTAIFVKKEVYQVGINWTREQEQYAIMIQAPFGQGVFRVESHTGTDQNLSVKLTMPDGQRYFSHSAESLLTQLFGWTIPISGLNSWIKGSPKSSETYTYELYADGRLKSLSQGGWQISYLDYLVSDGIELGLPKKMYLKHKNLALKIVVNRWKPLESQVNTVIFPEFN